MQRFLIAFPLAALIACGPSSRGNGTGGGGGGGGDDDDSAIDAATPLQGAEVCDDGVDNDGDGLTDCSDPDCSGVGNCPVCGQVQHPLGQPLELPDGVGGGMTNTWPACSTDAQCVNAMGDGIALPNCVAKECHASYTSTVQFTDFTDGQKVTAASNFLSVCVNMEHSWLRDLQIELIAPSGEKIALDTFQGRDGGEVFLGIPNDNDEGHPVPGTGSDYCWTPTSPNQPWQMYANAHSTDEDTYTLPPIPASGTMGGSGQGNYQSNTPWTAMVGATLNGSWTIRVTDLWEEDNGFIFKWSINFDPSILNTCAGPVIQ